MQHKLFLLFQGVFLLAFLSCNQSGKDNRKPEKIIDRETMIHLMADMDITDAALKIKQVGLKHDGIRQLSNKAYDSLYLYYKTTPEEFKRNVTYYQKDLDNYQMMMDEKITLLSKKKDSISVSISPVKIDTSKIKVKKSPRN
jgi:hypothetical protein